MSKIVKLKPNEIKAEILYINGEKQLQEFYWGNTFQSQSSRYVNLTRNVRQIRLLDNFGVETRKIETSNLEASIQQ